MLESGLGIFALVYVGGAMRLSVVGIAIFLMTGPVVVADELDDTYPESPRRGCEEGCRPG